MMRKLFKFVMALCLATFAIGALAWTGTTGSIGGTVEWRNHRRPSLPHFSRFLDSYHFFGFVSLSAEGSRTA